MGVLFVMKMVDLIYFCLICCSFCVMVLVLLSLVFVYDDYGVVDIIVDVEVENFDGSMFMLKLLIYNRFVYVVILFVVFVFGVLGIEVLFVIIDSSI